MSRLLGRIWVGGTTCLIAFLAFTSQLFIIWPWYGRELSVDLLLLLVPFNALVGMLYWNYYLSVTTNPGTVPRGWEPDTRSGDVFEVKKLTGVPRFCRMCNTFKPPRSHHCRQCRRCILRMDHHCPWVNNCVGHYNYGHFIRFLFYVDCAMTYHVTMLAMRTLAILDLNYWEGPDTLEFMMVIMNFVIGVPVLLCVGGFSLYHFYCMSSNSTTIEGWEKDKVATLVKKGRMHEVKFPYNLGRRANVESVLGKNPLLWCWPTVPPGNGLKFPVLEGGDSAGSDWPPPDPSKTMVYNDYRSPEDDDQSVILPGSPWTYENNSINPHLQPSNATRQRTTAAPPPIANVPPYHPDYVEPTATTTLSSTLADMVNSGYSSSSDIDSDEVRYGKENGKGKEHGKGNPRVRRGSEGYEIQSADREALFQEYIRSQGDNPRKYNFYEPEPHSDSESEGEGEGNGLEEEEDPEEFEPLSRQYEGTVVPQAA